MMVLVSVAGVGGASPVTLERRMLFAGPDLVSSLQRTHHSPGGRGGEGGGGEGRGGEGRTQICRFTYAKGHVGLQTVPLMSRTAIKCSSCS